MEKIKQFFKRSDVLEILSSALQAILTIIISQKAISKLQDK